MHAKVKERVSPLRRIRSQIDIMASILDEAVTEKAKTHIMYRCNLSYRQLQVYLKLLLRMGLLTLVAKSGSSKSDFFKTSAKGHEFLVAYRKLKSLMD